MNSLDIIILIIILIPTLFGLKNGLLKSIFSLIGIIAGFLIATRYNEEFSALFSFLKLDQRLLSLISFVVIMIFIYLIFGYVAGKISGLSVITRTADRLLGTFLGILKGLIIASLFLLLSSNTFNFFSKETVQKSKVYSSVINIAPDVYNFILELFPGAKNFYQEFNYLISKEF